MSKEKLSNFFCMVPHPNHESLHDFSSGRRSLKRIFFTPLSFRRGAGGEVIHRIRKCDNILA
jgi:hypothetical protein